jgi:hypothetical protein
MRKGYYRCVPLLALAVLFGAVRPAAAGVIYQAQTGTPQSATGISDLMDRTGLNGATVTAFFADGSSETRTWSGAGVSGTGWSLTITIPALNTLIDPWQLSNTRTANGKADPITKIVMDAGTGNSVFDRTLPSPGTPGSNIGTDLTQINRNGGLGGNNLDMRVTYFDIVQAGSNPPVGDLYRQLMIEFGTLSQGTFTPGGFTSANTLPASFLNPNGALNFFQDTDPVVTIRPAVPEPTSLALFGLGGVALAGWRRWQRKR